jgi:predicted MFS family arabinose efflux permease
MKQQLEHEKELSALFTADFLALNFVMFLTYCNIAVFFEFQNYLDTLNIPDGSIGFIIGIFSLSVLILRPIISPFMSADNARKWIFLSCTAVIISLISYNFAFTIISISIVRFIHGVAYVVLATAVLSKLVSAIPENKSGQAFGLISIITVLPFAIVPPILDPLIKWLGGFLAVLNVSAIVMLLNFPLLLLIKVNNSRRTATRSRFNTKEFVKNIANYSVILILLVGLIVWTTFTPVFYFIAKQGSDLHIPNAGLFFTFSTISEVAVRILCAPLFDKGNKSIMLIGSLLILVFGYIALAHVQAVMLFYIIGGILGLGWGIAMPLLNGIMFDISAPEFRPLNSNLAMQMFQMGFFLGPIAGNAIMLRWSYSVLYYICAVTLMFGVVMILAVNRLRSTS